MELEISLLAHAHTRFLANYTYMNTLFKPTHLTNFTTDLQKNYVTFPTNYLKQQHKFPQSLVNVV